MEEKTSFNPGVSFNTPMHNAITNFKGEYLTSTTSIPGALSYPFLSTPQGYSLGIGGQLSSDITRIEKVTYTYRVQDLLHPDPSKYPPCGAPGSAPSYYPRGTPFPLQSDLRIAEWLRAAAYPTFRGEAEQRAAVNLADDGSAVDAETLRTEAVLADQAEQYAPELVTASSAGAAGQNSQAITHEIKFEVITSGNITPTWHLVRVSANTNGGTNLFNTSRDRTSDLLITLAPAANPSCTQGSTYDESKKKCCKTDSTGATTCQKPLSGGSQGLELSQAGQNATLAAQIGLAVANSISGSLP